MDKIHSLAASHLFTEARTHSFWLNKPVSEAVLHELHDTAKFAPTSANCSPMRVVFVKTEAGKARLLPLIGAGNVEKTKSAPVTAILGYDMDFASHMPKLFPHVDARPWFAGAEEAVRLVAMRNSSIQAGFFILAARALGLDCGPMSGFDEGGVNTEFFAGTQIKANFLVNLGYGDPAKVTQRLPRFSFDEVCKIA